MQDQLIDFNILKPLGYEPTYHPVSKSDNMLMNAMKAAVEPHNYYLEMCLLQKWLREEHQIEINPYRASTISEDVNYVVVVKAWKEAYWEKGTFINADNGKPINHYDTYEEALQAGLQEAVKLI